MEMTPMSQQLLYTTVPIQTFDRNGDSNAMATGTLFSLPAKDGLKYPYLATNRHVLQDAERILLKFTEGSNGEPIVGSPIEVMIEDISGAVTYHQNELIDVAVLPLSNTIHDVRKTGKDFCVRSIPSEMVPGEEAMKEFNAIEDVIFVGYPVGVWDKKNLLPVFRKGITATPIFVDFEGLPVFLIDASVFPGSSGSPVFFYQHGFHTTRDGNSKLVINRANFLGIVAACYCSPTELSESVLKSAVRKVAGIYQQPANLGIVYKAQTVMETARFSFERSGVAYP